MEKKIVYNIYIEGRDSGIVKKLNKTMTFLELRKKLKNEISDKHFFSRENGCQISKEEEDKLTLEQIISENNIYIKKIHLTEFYSENKKLFEMEIKDPNISLSDLRKLQNKILDNYIFINENNNEIQKEDEEDFSISDIIHNGIIKTKIIDYNNDEEKQEKEKKQVEKKNNKENIKNEDKIKNEDEENGNKIQEIANEDKKENINEKIEKLFEYFDYFEDESKESDKIIIDKFNKKYNLYRGIKRFAIPVFGVISSGKSTFLNYLLNLNNLLEMDEQISTKFICIIRHNKTLKNPKLYEVKIDIRGEQSVNFEKGKEIKEDIKEAISKRNSDIKNEKLGRNPEKYFLLLETNIPFFNDDNDYFSDFYEFMDFPGLNEKDEKDNPNGKNKPDLFYKDYIPLILPNVKFAIFIFNLIDYKGDEAKHLIDYFKDFSKLFNFPYLEQICINSFNNSIFILNKIDLSERNMINEDINNFKECFKEKYFELNEDNFYGIIAKEKLFENNKYKSFIQYIEYILEDKSSEITNFYDKLNNKLQSELDLDNINLLKEKNDKDKNKDLNEEENNELNQIRYLINNSELIHDVFSIDNYLFYKNLFLKIQKEKKFEENNLHKILKNKMNKIYNDFTDLSEMEKYLKIIEEKENKEENKFKEFVKKMNLKLKKNIKYFTFKELSQNIAKTKQYLNNFFYISNSENWKKLIKKCDDFLNYYSSKNLSFKLLLLGKYGSGKSSLLNSIIGYDLNLLQTHKDICTKNAFIIKYCKDKESISMYKCNIKNTFKNYFISEELEKIANGKENVKKEIEFLNNININDNNSTHLHYYIIHTPIESLDNMDIDEEIKFQIEFIDLPGLDTYFGLQFLNEEKIFNLIDGIIYVNNSPLEGQNNKETFELIFNLIKTNINFSLKHLFFVNTYAESINKKTSIDTYRTMLNKIFEEKNESQNFLDIIKNNINEDQNEILVSKFSNSNYKLYQDFKYFKFESKTPEDLINHLETNYIIIDEKK